MDDLEALSTLALHGDDTFDKEAGAAPALHLSTTYQYPKDPELLVPIPYRNIECEEYYYSRITAPNVKRFETVLTELINADSVLYASGLAAFHACLNLLNPRKISIGKDTYFACQSVVDIVAKLSGLEKVSLDCPVDELQPGDLIMLETPLSPSGRAFNIAHFAEKAHSRGAYLLVSSTFAPPGLQDPFVQGADLVMHSGSKYFGGHSDLICGILATSNKVWIKQLKQERSIMGNALGNFESWLGLRSVRTLALRVERQSQSTGRLVSWLSNTLNEDGPDGSLVRQVITNVSHTSLQVSDFAWLNEQMPNGFGSVFSITMKSEAMARKLPSQLRIFRHHTSFGGVGSCLEWRKMSDVSTDPCLLRVSIGLEKWQDLQKDLREGFKGVLHEM